MVADAVAFIVSLIGVVVCLNSLVLYIKLMYKMYGREWLATFIGFFYLLSLCTLLMLYGFYLQQVNYEKRAFNTQVTKEKEELKSFN